MKYLCIIWMYYYTMIIYDGLMILVSSENIDNNDLNGIFIIEIDEIFGDKSPYPKCIEIKL